MRWKVRRSNTPSGGVSAVWERSFPFSLALRLARQTFAEQELQVELRSVGSALKTFRCDLRSLDGRWRAMGYGKGVRNQGVVGAVFEALEHLATDSAENGRGHAAALKTQSLQTIREQQALQSMAPIAFMPKQAKAREVCGLNVCPVTGEEVYFPVALMSPRTLDRRIAAYDDGDAPVPKHLLLWSEYSNNSGVAIGANHAEASLHGLLEAVERDTLARFLIATPLLRRTTNYDVVAGDTLPLVLRRLIDNASAECGSSVFLLRIINKAEIPCYLAFAQSSPTVGGSLGSGASLSNSHAVQRALTEMVQCHHVSDTFDRTPPIMRLSEKFARVAESSMHSRICRFDLQHLIGPKKPQPFSETGAALQTLPQDQLWEALRRLRKVGRKCYFRTLVRFGSGVTVVHALLSDQDFSFMVSEGCRAVPNRTTIRELAASIEA